MASSQQCGNCGVVGHFRANCPLPKNESLCHWAAAKKQFRRENPEELRKQEERREQNRKWQTEGSTISYYVLSDATKVMLQSLHDLSSGLDVLGRPEDWQAVNKKLDLLLPDIRELSNIGKGFINSGRAEKLDVDADIFVSRIYDLKTARDELVQKVKSFVNGKLGKLASIHSRNSPEEFLRFIYSQHPPKRGFVFEANDLKGSTLKIHLKKALLNYHPDKQVEFDHEWRCLCEAISRCLTVAYQRFH